MPLSDKIINLEKEKEKFQNKAILPFSFSKCYFKPNHKAYFRDSLLGPFLGSGGPGSSTFLLAGLCGTLTAGSRGGRYEAANPAANLAFRGVPSLLFCNSTSS